MPYDQMCAAWLDALRRAGRADILAIETSCDETAAAVIRDGRAILSNIVSTQIPIHARYGGVVPEVASRAHVEAVNAAVDQALEGARLRLNDIDAIAVTNGPGLVGALLVGVSTAKALAFASSKPLIAVHHMEAHISAAYLAYDDLEPPFLCLTVSGGHTALIETTASGESRALGRTLDDAAGEAFDKAARVLGLPYPGGPALDELAERGNPSSLALPRAKTPGAYDFSFSGLKTAFIQLERKGALAGVSHEDAAAAFREAVTDMLAVKTIRAAKAGGYHTVAVVGGVAANKGLRARMARECGANGLRLCVPPVPLCTDNAAMVGAAAFRRITSGKAAGSLSLNAEPAGYIV
ncbi:MAG: tRNA (adenosine(37)-N6)-threonylcarbamoyltransferase complex transferase subunit TsaD [Oscillospiraceae bacterium]|jgi:N6-L-threonylcarbamoyladenine synthase|nr:tRNA (adenosine(37)-N6)-threonylcarbamoyltransferase complex transferase subunit TsaD [Oscillospiraceae bacterium]